MDCQSNLIRALPMPHKQTRTHPSSLSDGVTWTKYLLNLTCSMHEGPTEAEADWRRRRQMLRPAVSRYSYHQQKSSQFLTLE